MADVLFRRFSHLVGISVSMQIYEGRGRDTANDGKDDWSSSSISPEV
jgi:hypothetical protein